MELALHKASWDTDFYSKRSPEFDRILICGHGLRKCVDVPMSCKKIVVVATKRARADSFDIYRFHSTYFLRDVRQFMTGRLRQWLGSAYASGYRHVHVEY